MCVRQAPSATSGEISTEQNCASDANITGTCPMLYDTDQFIRPRLIRNQRTPGSTDVPEGSQHPRPQSAEPGGGWSGVARVDARENQRVPTRKDRHWFRRRVNLTLQPTKKGGGRIPHGRSVKPTATAASAPILPPWFLLRRVPLAAPHSHCAYGAKLCIAMSM